MRDKTTPDRMDITTVEIEADAPYEELLKRAKEQTD